MNNKGISLLDYLLEKLDDYRYLIWILIFNYTRNIYRKIFLPIFIERLGSGSTPKTQLKNTEKIDLRFMYEILLYRGKEIFWSWRSVKKGLLTQFLDFEFWIFQLEFWFMNFGFWILNIELRIPNLDFEFRILNDEYWILNF